MPRLQQVSCHTSWHGCCRSQLGECSGTWLLGVPVVCVMGFLIRSNCFSLELPSFGNCPGFKLGTVWPSTHGQNNPGGILSAFPQLKRLQGATQAGGVLQPDSTNNPPGTTQSWDHLGSA